jgi:glutamine amidotransferase-like uncharacterized protein
LLGSCLLNLSFPSEVSAQSRKIRVALFIDNGASIPARKNFRREFNNSNDDAITHQEVDGNDIANGALKDFDALIVPGGSAQKEARSMGPDAREEVRRFVKEGGIYMGVCAGAYLSSQAKDNDLGLLPLTTLDQEHWYRVNDGTPVEVELTPLGMQVFGLNSSRVKIVYENGPIFTPLDGNFNDNLTPLGFYRSEVVARGGERGVMLGAPAMVLGRYGKGVVLAISPHPEKTPGMRQIELYAIHWLYDHRAQNQNPNQNHNRKTENTSNSQNTNSSQRVNKTKAKNIAPTPAKYEDGDDEDN